MKAKMIGALLGLALVSGAAQAALHDRGGGLVYDDVLNITWLGDANYAKTSGYDEDGRMSWTTAKTWADDLSYYDSRRNVTYTDWRLPTMLDTGTTGCNRATSGTDCGYNVQTVAGATVFSELAHKYYNNLGNQGYFNASGDPQPGWGPIDDTNNPNDESLISNLQLDGYWTGLEYAEASDHAWVFFMHSGDQYVNGKVNDAGGSYGWAVRSGDVAAVPEPESFAFMLAGLGLVGWAARRPHSIKPICLFF